MYCCQLSSGFESFLPPGIKSPAAGSVMPTFWARTEDLGFVLPKTPLESSIWSFNNYDSLVDHYMSRKLTYNSDILHAFTGIMRKLERSTGMTFVKGMPAGDLLRALLWTLSEYGTFGPTKKYLPSWTWAAWDCNAFYRMWELDESLEGDALYSKSFENRDDLAAQRAVHSVTLSSPVPVFVSTGNRCKPDLFPAFRLRRAEVSLFSTEGSIDESRLRVVSETRAVLAHLR